MADVSVNSSVSALSVRGIRALVFIDKDVGYHFLIAPANGSFGYHKTTDGGQSWGSFVEIAGAVGHQAFDVWFDQWTSGDSGNLIHIARFDTTADDVLYQNLDTTDDSLSTPVVVEAESTAASSIGAHVSITKTRGGNLAVSWQLDAGAEFGFETSTDGGASWVAKTNAVEAVGDWMHLFPGNAADANDVWGLYFDDSASALTLKVFDDSADTWSESSTIATVTGNNTDGLAQYPFSGSVRHSDGHLIVAVVTERDTATADHRVFDINGTGSISELTAITTDIDDHYYPSVFIDQNTDDIYVAYIGARDGSEILATTGGTCKVYYTVSTDGGSSWSSGDTAYQETANANPVRTYAPISGDRFYVTWRVSTNSISGNYVNSIDVSAASGITADLDATLGALTVDGDADVAIAASLSEELGALTVDASASLAITADLDATLGALTLSASAGPQPIVADLDATLGTLTLSASAALGIAADLDATLGALTLAAVAGDSTIDAELDVTLGSLTLVADATVPQPASQQVGGGVVWGAPKRRRRKPSFIGTPDSKPSLPKINARLDAQLGALSLKATARVHLSQRGRRKVLAALLLH